MSRDADFSDWAPRARPGTRELIGTRVVLQPLDWNRHGDPLFATIGGKKNDELWRYIPFGPFGPREEFERIFELIRSSQSWQTMIITDVESADVLGMASYMAISEQNGSAEIGCVIFGQKMQRTAGATEALYLMARHLFDDLAYRRYEWKCDNTNVRSRRAAARFGFQYEGLFRNHMIAKGLNRDTTWFSIIDSDWPDLEPRLRAWLAEENFDSQGQQRTRLEEVA